MTTPSHSKISHFTIYQYISVAHINFFLIELPPLHWEESPSIILVHKLCYFLQSDEVFLEAQIQNITPNPVYMEHVTLDPSQQYNAKELNTVDGKET